MDELFELMEDSVPADAGTEAQDNNNSVVDPMDELALLMGQDDDDNDDDNNEKDVPTGEASRAIHSENHRSTNKRPIVTPSSSSSSRPSNNRKSNENDHRRRHCTNPKKTAEASIVDDRLGIRMLKRLVSSVDLDELMTTHPYFSPATLSAMPLAKLNTLLLDPARIVDPATVSGKTNLVTVGLVFSNSGTRISSKGGSAFCVVTIGSNLASGPCVTLFLFGDVYGKYCRTCTPGKVVAVMGPKLLPSNRKDGGNSNNNDCAVSFSLYDRGQLQLVATARDYGTCQGTVRVKLPNGTWSNTGSCKCYVDTRVSEYCAQHRRQQTSGKQVGAVSNNKFQQLKQQQQEHQAQPFRAPSVLLQAAPQSGGMQRSSKNRLLNPSTTHQGNLLMSTRQSQQPHLQQQQATGVRNPLFTNVQRSPPAPPQVSNLLGGSVPIHMNKTATSSSLPMHAERRRQANRGVAALHGRKTNAAVAAAGTTAGKGDNKHPPTFQPKANVDLLQRAMSQTKPSGSRAGGKPLSTYLGKGSKRDDGKSSNNNKRRKVNTDGSAGFDGSVQVPKPSRLFQSQDSTALAKIGQSSSTRPNASGIQEQVLQRQAELARLRHERQSTIGSDRPSARTAKRQNENSKNGASAHDAFAAALGGGDVDLEKVRNAKSRFANEIEAEEYAASRQKVVELEKLEGRQNAKTNKDKNNSKGGEHKRLHKAWKCKTCSQSYSMKPKSCYRAGHDVITVRTIREEKTKDEARTAMHSKSSKDGGLQLGAGLEWSDRFPGNRYLR